QVCSADIQAIKSNVVSDTVLNGLGRCVVFPRVKRDCEMVSQGYFGHNFFLPFSVVLVAEFLAPCTKVNLFDYRFSIDMLDPQKISYINT
ncbi:MAG TPA: hypothetical protein PKZ89_06930, partial [Alphaproteobacteria bacterium]|nr:hypothetical protein [Alphaproteobacteria bacterium]